MSTSTADTTTGPAAPAVAVSGERADLLESLAKHRFFLRFTVRGLDDEQASRRSTASELTLAGVIKHVCECEAMWTDFIVNGTSAIGDFDAAALEAADDRFEVPEGETLESLLARYDEVARATDALIAGLPDLDVSHPLPKAPWFDGDASWSARRVLLHVIAETAQHAGHADIIRESIDGAKSMG